MFYNQDDNLHIYNYYYMFHFDNFHNIHFYNYIYYYFNENNEYACTINNFCPQDFSKLIAQKKKCIDDCKKDDEYKYEYNNNCLKECPENTKIYEEEKKCLESCHPNQFEYNKICYDDLSNDTSKMFQNWNIFVNNISNFDDILNDIILDAYSPEEGNSLVIKRPDNTVYHVTNTKTELELLKNKSNNFQNLSIIDLGECESILKQRYNISESVSLILIKNEQKTTKASEKMFNFDVYEPYNKTKLNLSICDETSINLYIPVELSQENKKIYAQMKESGFDMFNIEDPFYQDICIPFDSTNGTDILLSDRVDYIYNNDDTQCQSNCQFSHYSVESQYMNCSCSTNKETNYDNNKKDKFTAKKIYESFYDVLKYSNYKIIKCANVIVDIKNIKSNKGSIIVIVYFSCYIICLFSFIFIRINPLKNKLVKDLNIKPNVKNILFPPIKKFPFRKLILRKDLQKRNKIIETQKVLKFKFNKQSKSKVDDNIKIYSNYNSKSAFDNSPKDKLDNLNLKELGDFSSNKNETENSLERKYDDYELNELEYDEALELDKRTLMQIYWASLKREHLIIFTFFNCNDYNLLPIKLSRFVFLVVSDMALNVFFFSDDSMHKLFLNYGKYDFFQQIPQITYSTIISQLIEIFLCFLSLTDKYFYRLKSVLIDKKKNVDISKITRCIYIKLFFFYLFTFIFFAAFWYIISIFCGVYRNTQISFIKDSLISFAICLTYPLVFYFISAALRFCSLRNPKKNFKCMYNISYIIPLF